MTDRVEVTVKRNGEVEDTVTFQVGEDFQVPEQHIFETIFSEEVDIEDKEEELREELDSINGVGDATIEKIMDILENY